jgi:hypothetical protein
MACQPLIADSFIFPRRVDNRAGLPRIAYRIGRYQDFVEVMERGIDAAPELAAWTHREADDPGIAIMQGAAILGDILTFYQEHYANEAWLRTAVWRESIAELVRLTGYRLVPGLGGRATLAFEARGASPLKLRGNFPVKLELEGLATRADFQTDAELEVWPHLGRFNLYRARAYGGTIPANITQFEIKAVDGAGDSLSLAAFELKAGDKLMLQPPEPAYTSSGSVITEQQAPHLAKVKSVTRSLDRLIVEIDAPLAEPWPVPATAFRIGRTFRHFGHNAPPKTVTATPSSGTITGASQSDTRFDRHLHAGHECTQTSLSTALPARLWPLDSEVNDLAAGTRLLVQVLITNDANDEPRPLSVTRRITKLHNGALGFGNLNGASTQLTLDAAVIRHSMSPAPFGDVRDMRLHEATSPPLTLRPLSEPSSDAFTSGTNALRFYGTVDQVQALAGRWLFLSHADGRAVELINTNEPGDFTTSLPRAPRRWPLSFDRSPAPFTRADFDEAEPTVTVFGNLVDASQGKAEPDAALGNGDNRQLWQTFALPKAPLTYFLASDAVPPQVPELEIRVAGRVWTRVDSFFGRGPKEQIYIVREDTEGRSFVQFGDGQTGARLPSGLKNVVAVYRSGAGARGPLKAGSKPSSLERPPGFDKVSLAGIASGGTDPESGDKAREAAPGKVQSLGRLVSVRDYETELLSIPGVVTAAAAWDLYAGVPALILRVLLEAGREAEFTDVRDSIAHAQRCRGPDRFALVVQQALPRFAFADLAYARDPSFVQADVEAAIRAELGLAGDTANEPDGLFGLHARRLGDPEYASRIEGRAQNLPGVLWCKITGLGRFAAGATDPAVLALPATPRPAAAMLACSPLELLQLASQHLTLTPVDEPAAGECA